MPRYSKKTKSTKQIAEMALKKVRKLERRPELKYADGLITQAATNIGTTYQLITGGGSGTIAQGVSFNQRIGDQVQLQKFEANFNIAWNATPTAQQIRVLLVRGHAEDSVACNYNDALQNSTIYALRTRHDMKKVTVLMDKVYSVNRDTGVAINKTFSRINKKLGWKALYTTAGTAPEDGGLYLMIVSDQGADYPVFNFSYRVTYYDS